MTAAISNSSWVLLRPLFEPRGSNHGGTTLTLAEQTFGVKENVERVFATNA